MSRPARPRDRRPRHNRDRDARARARTRRRRRRRSCSPPSWPTRPATARRRPARSCVAGGFCYGDALGAGRMLALDLDAPASAIGLRGVRRHRQAGDRHLQRVPGAHPRQAAARARSATTPAVGSSVAGSCSNRSRVALRLDRRASTTRSTARSPTARVGTCTPTRPRSPPPARSRCATAAPTRTARSPTSPACATRPATCSA